MLTAVAQQEQQKLIDRYVVPPFNVLNARSGYWQDRKRLWHTKLGMKSGAGRGGPSNGKGDSRMMAHDPLKDDSDPDAGKSIFDPVLCELVYRWFSAPGQLVLDPFAGGSVRGVVAATLYREYFGCDLRPEQIEANQQQWRQIEQRLMRAGVRHKNPLWVQGDSAQIQDKLPGEYDLVFSCPPYHSLESYGGGKDDLSEQDYPTFRRNYRKIIKQSVAMLKANRFAVFVIQNIRDPESEHGFFEPLVIDTVQAFEAAGAGLYNDAILITAVGSMQIRAQREFLTLRRLVKGFQNVLVFCKGSPAAAARAVGPLDDTVLRFLRTKERFDLQRLVCEE